LEHRLRLTVAEEVRVIRKTLRLLWTGVTGGLAGPETVRATAPTGRGLSEPRQEALQEALAVLYRADEVAQRYAHTLGRAAHWMQLMPLEQARAMERLFRQVFHEYRQMVPSVRELYGEMETRYIVPFEYRLQRGV
ncbi:MAG: hypothetical protein K6T26_08080, partial [Alicyclobacillus sp.]|nr:hypothetical protein [Alicyclobacillus sp.]